MESYQNEQQKLYLEELKEVSKRRSLRNVTLLSAMIEAHIFSLAKTFLEKKGVIYSPSEFDEYRMSINILKSNNLLSPDELRDVNEFRRYRKEIFHNLFKGKLTRAGLNDNINKAWTIGKKVVKKLSLKQL
ncbi:MAG: hypothetical protein Q8P75_04365 [bacterium]|nr:hypothetical protein [bacterium]